MRTTLGTALGSMILVGLLGPGRAIADTPVVASPGSPQGTLVESRCPSFSWGSVSGARAFHLVVYRFGDNGEETTPVLEMKLDGTVTSWTPALDRCLTPGASYAWSVRAVLPKKKSEWSAPSLFRVAQEPTLEEALRVVRDHLAANRTRDDTASSPRVEDSAPMASGRLPSPGPSSLGAHALGTAELTVEGEVRTIDSSGEPRLWGRGRPNNEVFGTNVATGMPCIHGGIKFGLSKNVAEWGNAEQVCPAGTWVCRPGEFTGCDTNRPDTADQDYYDCSGQAGVNLSADSHWGWVADSSPSDSAASPAHFEIAGSATVFNCARLPAWCCWE